MELAQSLWGDRYQVVVATHLDKANHLHNHFVLNTVSFVDGIKYHRTAKDYHDLQPYRVPKRVQDVIPIKCMWSDGIFLVGTRYSKTFKFTDINYMVASQEAQKKLFLAYAALINSLDCGATTKITLNNRHLNRKNFADTVLMKLKNDYLDYYRMEYNDVIMSKATGGNGIIQEKYVTVSVCKKNIEDARAYFARVGAELTARFAALGAKVAEMDATEKLRVLHDFYRSGEEVYFWFDAQDMMRKGHDFRDYICPDSIEKHSDYLMLGGKYARVIYLKDYASFISDQLVTKLTDQSRSMMLSIDIIPVATDEAVREVERKMLGVETNITNWQRRQNANNNFSAIVPYDMEQQRRETKEYMTDLTSRDQRMMLSVLTIVHLADSKAELDADTDALLKVAADHMCQMAVLRYQQLDGLNTALPIGTRKIDTFRTLTTESLAVFMPFKVQEIQEPGGIYFGENAISHNLILCNMKNLLNQSMMLLGIPGSGKSFFAKLLIVAIALSTKDDIIILDPEGEYTPLVKALGGAVMCFAVGGSDWLNAMAMEEGYGEGSPVAFKSQFIMSLLKQIDPDGIRAHHKSIIDRCVALVLQEQKKTGKVPTLCTLREKLLEQPEQEAGDLALTMELYTSGSLNIFAHETNVDTKNRIQSYDIHDLGEELKQPGFVTITDAMINRVNYNWAHGKKTHIFVDEFHIAYENEYSGNFFTSAWRQFRKRNAAPCAITQNVEYMLDSV